LHEGALHMQTHTKYSLLTVGTALLLVASAVLSVGLIPQAAASSCSVTDGDNDRYNPAGVVNAQDPTANPNQFDYVQNSKFNLSCVVDDIPIGTYSATNPGWYTDHLVSGLTGNGWKAGGSFQLNAAKESVLGQAFNTALTSEYRGVSHVAFSYTGFGTSAAGAVLTISVDLNDVGPADQLLTGNPARILACVVVPITVSNGQSAAFDIPAANFKTATGGCGSYASSTPGLPGTSAPQDPTSVIGMLSGVISKLSIKATVPANSPGQLKGRISDVHAFAASPVLRPALAQQDNNADNQPDEFWVFNDYNQNDVQDAGEPDLSSQHVYNVHYTHEETLQPIGSIGGLGGLGTVSGLCEHVTFSDPNTQFSQDIHSCEVVHYPRFTMDTMICNDGAVPQACQVAFTAEVCAPSPTGPPQCIPFEQTQSIPTVPKICPYMDDSYASTFPYGPGRITAGIRLDGNSETGWQTGRDGDCSNDAPINIVDVDASLIGPLIPVRPLAESRLSLDSTKGYIAYDDLIAGDPFNFVVDLVCPNGKTGSVTMSGYGGTVQTFPWPSTLDGCPADGTWRITTANTALAGFFAMSFDGGFYWDQNTWQVGTREPTQQAYVALDPVNGVWTTTWADAGLSQKFFTPST
jgi:hypothetical protein